MKDKSLEFYKLKTLHNLFYLLPVYQKYSKKRMSVKIILLWYYAIHDFIMVIKYYVMKISFHKISWDLTIHYQNHIVKFL